MPGYSPSSTFLIKLVYLTCPTPAAYRETCVLSPRGYRYWSTMVHDTLTYFIEPASIVLFFSISNWKRNCTTLGNSCPACRATAAIWKTSFPLKKRKQQQQRPNSFNFSTVKTSHFRVFSLFLFICLQPICAYYIRAKCVPLSALRLVGVTGFSHSGSHKATW